MFNALSELKNLSKLAKRYVLDEVLVSEAIDLVNSGYTAHEALHEAYFRIDDIAQCKCCGNEDRYEYIYSICFEH